MAVLMYPIATEKALNMVETQNTITYVVDFRADKKKIKGEFEKMFNVKVQRVNVAVEPYNEKRAYIRLSKESSAPDIAKKLKLV